jgi:hypothetical protein
MQTGLKSTSLKRRSNAFLPGKEINPNVLELFSFLVQLSPTGFRKGRTLI